MRSNLLTKISFLLFRHMFNGNPGAEKQSENMTTRTRSLDMNATGGTVNKNPQPAAT